MLTETRDGETRRLPTCEPECSGRTCEGTFVIPDGADACVAWQTQAAQQACLAPGLGAEALVFRREPSWDTLEYEVTCGATI